MVDLLRDLERHVRDLAGRIGTRYVGSSGNHAAAEYIPREVERCGLAVDLQRSDCPEWAVYADPCSPPVEVTGPVVPLRTIPELEAVELRGRIALPSATLPRETGKDLLRKARARLESYPGTTWVDPWLESDHSSFPMRGVPALAFSSTGAREVAHSTVDTVEGIGFERLNDAASLAAEIVMAMQNGLAEWGRA